MADRDAARVAKRHVSELVAGIPHVNGVGLRRRQADWVVKVNLTDDDDPTLRRQLPGEVDGVAVEIEVVGTIASQPG